MAPKRKSTLSRNPLCSGSSSSSSSPFDPTPSHIRFHDEKAKLDFFGNFSQHDIHLERQVILLDFSNTDLPTVIYNIVGSHYVAPWSRALHTRVLLEYARIWLFYTPIFYLQSGYMHGSTSDIVYEVLHVP